MSEYRRFFAEKTERDGEKIHLTNEYNHISKVLRMKQGDNLIVCFNDGAEHFCQIDSIDKTFVHLSILKTLESQTENSFRTVLFSGALKGDKNELVIQKAVELGVNEIVFFNSTFSVAKFDSSKTERFNRISIEASKQCGRAFAVPVRCLSFNEMLARLHSFEKTIVCFERERSTNLNAALEDRPQNLALIVGSEGGFSDAEIEKLTALKAVAVTLGKRILRAETAPLYALSVIDNLLN